MEASVTRDEKKESRNTVEVKPEVGIGCDDDSQASGLGPGDTLRSSCRCFRSTVGLVERRNVTHARAVVGQVSQEPGVELNNSRASCPRFSQQCQEIL